MRRRSPWQPCERPPPGTVTLNNSVEYLPMHYLQYLAHASRWREGGMGKLFSLFFLHHAVQLKLYQFKYFVPVQTILYQSKVKIEPQHLHWIAFNFSVNPCFSWWCFSFNSPCNGKDHLHRRRFNPQFKCMNFLYFTYTYIVVALLLPCSFFNYSDCYHTIIYPFAVCAGIVRPSMLFYKNVKFIFIWVLFTSHEYHWNNANNIIISFQYFHWKQRHWLVSKPPVHHTTKVVLGKYWYERSI